MDGHPGKLHPLESHGREALGKITKNKCNVEDGHDRTASGVPADENGETKSGDREQKDCMLWLIE